MADQSRNTEHRSPRYAESLDLGNLIQAVLRQFWVVRGSLVEGRERILVLLSRADMAAIGPTKGPTKARARALVEAGTLTVLTRSYGSSQWSLARSRLEKGLAMCREADDREGAALALVFLGSTTRAQGEYSLARSYYEQSMTIYRELQDRSGIARCQANLGALAHGQADNAAAHSLLEQALELSRELGDKVYTTRVLVSMGELCYAEGNYATARSLSEESLTLSRELKHRGEIAESLHMLGVLARVEGDYARAGLLHEEALELYRELGRMPGYVLASVGYVANRQGDYRRAGTLFAEGLSFEQQAGGNEDLALCLIGSAGVAVGGADPTAGADREARASSSKGARRAARLLGAAEALLEAIGKKWEPADRIEYDRYVAATRAQLDEAAFDAAWAEGRAMSMEQAISYALSSAVSD